MTGFDPLRNPIRIANNSPADMVVNSISIVVAIALIANLFHFRAGYGFLKPVQAEQHIPPPQEPPQCFTDCAEAVFPCEAIDSACICEFVLIGVVDVMDRCLMSLCEEPDTTTAFSWMNSACEEQLGTLFTSIIHMPFLLFDR